ncbi:MAG: hypothetical protein HN742_32250 [Lentisphaerae bacterium]|jgi:hypothetical protein|nr:hypothetical protein [Lentisphaerota bacterium]MBT4816843.1 hypothetical protein [Lentisphaerota bacterium]MBT5611097.1 hypothetical protein [Lentisphaerota bacterium]MBT7055639.1 hypothetical protein [Lentisphaerota bacterium]MBT7846586.1 hypothetical protein [Lentisphaerota bacterium]
MMKRAAILIGIALIVSPALAEPGDLRVATIYSSWNQGAFSFKDEWDRLLEARGASHDCYENTQITELAGKLDGYDIVIGCSVLNLENTQDFGPVKEPFMRFLENGGIFLLTDASYASSHAVIGTWSPDFALSSATASAHSRPSEETRRISLGNAPGLAQVPHDLLPLAQAAGHWAHMVCTSPSWQQALVDSDGKPVLAWQPVGKGVLVATSYYSFKRQTASEFGEALLDNLLVLAEGTQAGFQIQELSWGQTSPGTNVARLRVRHAQGRARKTAIRFRVSQGDEILGEDQIPLPVQHHATATAEWPYTIPRRGPIQLELAGLAEGENGPVFRFTKLVDIPNLLEPFAWKRHYYRSDTHAELRVDFLPQQPFVSAGHRLEVQAVVKGVVGAVVTVPPESQDVNVPLVGLPVGKGVLAVSLWRQDEKLGGAEQSFEIALDPYVRILPDRSCQVGGKPFFPLGMYIVSWKLKGTEAILEKMQAIAAGGFNVVHVGVRSEEEFRAVLDEAKRLSIMIIPEGGIAVKNPGRFKEHPSILAWNPGDEPDGRGRPPEYMASVVGKIKDQDTSRPTYMTLCVPSTYERYWQAADIIAPDPYPIPRKSIAYVADCVERLQEVMQRGKPIWAIPQAFGGYSSWKRVPTPEEERNMTYQCLVHGARGLIYYTYWDGRFDMAEHPELWAMMTQLAREVRQLTPLLLDGSPEQVLKLGTDGAVHVLLKSAQGRHYAIAVNTMSAPVEAVSVPVTQVYTGIIKELFGDGEATARDGRLTLKLSPLGVQVYACP